MIKIIVPGEPKGKARPRVTSYGHAYTPKETVLYENLVKTLFISNYPQFEPMLKEVGCKIKAYYSIPKSTSKKQKELMLLGRVRPTKKPDLDNIAKAILDSLNGLAYKDDSQVTELTIEKYYSEKPETVIELRLIS